MARIFTAVPLAALLATTLVPAPGSANDGNAGMMGAAAGIAAFGLAAALIGQSGRLHVYPVPPVLVIPEPAAASAATTVTPPRQCPR